MLYFRDDQLGSLPESWRAVDIMRNSAKMVGFPLIERAGHWVQQEQPEEVSTLLLQFLRQAKACFARFRSKASNYFSTLDSAMVKNTLRMLSVPPSAR
jgi:hypothetical protein